MVLYQPLLDWVMLRISATVSRALYRRLEVGDVLLVPRAPLRRGRFSTASKSDGCLVRLCVQAEVKPFLLVYHMQDVIDTGRRHESGSLKSSKGKL